MRNKTRGKNFIKKYKVSRRNVTKKHLVVKNQLNIYKIVIIIIFLFFSYILNAFENNNKIIKNNKSEEHTIINNIKNEEYKIKVCLCTLAKKENNYMREFVTHYEKYGIYS